jgi:putative Mg2+ transporter-C (MgtC) family protein
MRVDAVAALGGWQEILLRLGAATAIGCVLGLNREIHGKPAGLRIHGLVCLGSSLLVLSSLQLTLGTAALDSSAVLRTVQGIISGIGFLGGGVILRDDSHHSVHGLTTAASVWVVACLGIACGLGLWLTALTALALTLTVLIVGGRIETAIRGRFGPQPGAEETSAGAGRPLV